MTTPTLRQTDIYGARIAIVAIETAAALATAVGANIVGGAGILVVTSDGVWRKETTFVRSA